MSGKTGLEHLDEGVEVGVEHPLRVGGEAAVDLACCEAKDRRADEALDSGNVGLGDASHAQAFVDVVACPLGGWGRRRALEQEREDRGVPTGHGSDRLADLDEDLVPAELGVRSRVGDLVEQPLDEAVEEVGLVAHMPIQRHRRDPEPVGDGLHRQAVEASLVSEFEARLQDAGTVDEARTGHVGSLARRRPNVYDQCVRYILTSMRVLLTEGSGLTSKQVASRLMASGHEVGVLSSDPIFLTRFTRATSAWHRVPAFGPDPFGWLDAALDIYHRHGYHLVFPTQEPVTVLAAEAERLQQEGVRTAVPPFAALAAVQSKVAAKATLDRLGLPQPPTMVLADVAAIDAFEGFPVFVKAPIGTASGGVELVHDRADLERLLATWNLDDALALGGVVAQTPADGPLAMIQSVFDHGSLVAFHANVRTREGARGGASHKRSVALPAAREAFETLGVSLGWHGALSADVIVTADGPQVIDVNPRLVEPANAWAAGVDLVGTMVELGSGGHPAPQGATREAVSTHQLLLAIGGAAQQGRGRRGVASELVTAATRRGSYCNSVEELSSAVRERDPAAALPLLLAAAVALVRPASWTWFSSGSVASYALSPSGWRTILGRRSA